MVQRMYKITTHTYFPKATCNLQPLGVVDEDDIEPKIEDKLKVLQLKSGH